MSQPLSELQDKLGYEFKNRDLLKQALTCQSAINEHHHDAASENYQVLEFVGDAALKYAVVSLLYGDANRTWSAETIHDNVVPYIGVENLSRIGRKLNLDQYIVKGKGVTSCTDKMLADAVEAILGAIMVDQQRQGITSGSALLDFVTRHWSITQDGASHLLSTAQRDGKPNKCCCCCEGSCCKGFGIFCLVLIACSLAVLALWFGHGADL